MTTAEEISELSIPSIRDRVVQGALKAILEPIFEADSQPGSFAYRPGRGAHHAIHRVLRAIEEGKTRIIDLDFHRYFDSVRHHILFEKVAKRVDDDQIMALLKRILKAGGKRGLPQGGVISPLLSNLYLNGVDRVLEQIRWETQQGSDTAISWARYADDLVVLVDPSSGICQEVEDRLHEEFEKLQLKVNAEKTHRVDLLQGESLGFLGFDIRCIRTGCNGWSKPPYLSYEVRKLHDLNGLVRPVKVPARQPCPGRDRFDLVLDSLISPAETLGP